MNLASIPGCVCHLSLPLTRWTPSGRWPTPSEPGPPRGLRTQHGRGARPGPGAWWPAAVLCLLVTAPTLCPGQQGVVLAVTLGRVLGRLAYISRWRWNDPLCLCGSLACWAPPLREPGLSCASPPDRTRASGWAWLWGGPPLDASGVGLSLVGAVQSRWSGTRQATSHSPMQDGSSWAGRAPGSGCRGRRRLEWLGGPSPGLLVLDEAGVSGLRPGPLAGGREAQRPVGAAVPGACPTQGVGKAGGGVESA